MSSEPKMNQISRAEHLTALPDSITGAGLVWQVITRHWPAALDMPRMASLRLRWRTQQDHQFSRELLVLMLLKWETLGADTDPSLIKGPAAAGAVAAAVGAGGSPVRVLSRARSGSEANCRGDNPGPGATFQSGAADARQRLPIGFHPGGDVPGHNSSNNDHWTAPAIFNSDQQHPHELLLAVHDRRTWFGSIARRLRKPRR